MIQEEVLMKTLNEFFQRLWVDYAAMNDQADAIHKLLEKKGEQIINDHIAFRTVNVPKLGIDAIAKTFVQLGYEPKGEYKFEEKKLRAKHFEHKDPNQPKVFISELKLEECSEYLQKIMKGLVSQVSDKDINREDFVVCGCPWKPISSTDYEKLKAESEYAAWFAVFGFRVNHFTVFVNALKNFKDLEGLNAFLKRSGFPLNSSGGEIKGSPQKDFLVQSSTMASRVKVEFSDKKETVPGCYYEFARRFPLPNGKLFQGFVVQSADKIFESTDNKS